MNGRAKNVSMLEALGIMDEWRRTRCRIFFVFGKGDIGRWISLIAAKETSPGIGVVRFKLASGYHRRIALPRSGSISLIDSRSGVTPAIFGRRWDSVIAVKSGNGFRLFFCRIRAARDISVTITQ